MDISEKQAVWREQKPLFEAEFIHSHLLPFFNFNENTGDYEIKSECVNNTDDEDRKVAYEALNTGWVMWLRAKRDAKAQAVQEWISVKDNLPPANILVLGMSQTRSNIFNIYNVMALDEFEEVEVTHWMPLPDAPKADAEKLKGCMVVPKDQTEDWYLDDNANMWITEPDEWLCDLYVGEVQSVEHKEYLITKSDTLYAAIVWDDENQDSGTWEFFKTEEEAEKAAAHCKAMLEAARGGK